MYFSSWFQSFICINLFDSMKVNKLFWYCLCLFILATDKIKFAWKSTFSLILTIIARLNSVSSPPKSPHDLLTASEREIRGRGSFWKSRLKKRGRVKWSGDPPLTGATCLPEHPGGIGARNSRNLNSFSIHTLPLILKIRKTYREDGEFSGTLN